MEHSIIQKVGGGANNILVSYHSGARNSKSTNPLGLRFSNSDYVTSANETCTVIKPFTATVYLSLTEGSFSGGYRNTFFFVNGTQIKNLSTTGYASITESIEYSFNEGDVYYFNANGADAANNSAGNMVVVIQN